MFHQAKKHTGSPIKKRELDLRTGNLSSLKDWWVITSLSSWQTAYELSISVSTIRHAPVSAQAIFILSLIGLLWSNNYRITYSNHNYRPPFLTGVPSDKFLVKLTNSTSFMKRMESDWVHDSLRVTTERLNRWREPSPHWSHHDAMSQMLILALTLKVTLSLLEAIRTGQCSSGTQCYGWTRVPFSFSVGKSGL